MTLGFNDPKPRFQRIRGFTTMRYINRLFTYLLIYLDFEVTVFFNVR